MPAACPLLGRQRPAWTRPVALSDGVRAPNHRRWRRIRSSSGKWMSHWPRSPAATVCATRGGRCRAQAWSRRLRLLYAHPARRGPTASRHRLHRCSRAHGLSTRRRNANDRPVQPQLLPNSCPLLTASATCCGRCGQLLDRSGATAHSDVSGKEYICNLWMRRAVVVDLPPLSIFSLSLLPSLHPSLPLSLFTSPEDTPSTAESQHQWRVRSVYVCDFIKLSILV